MRAVSGTTRCGRIRLWRACDFLTRTRAQSTEVTSESCLASVAGVAHIAEAEHDLIASLLQPGGADGLQISPRWRQCSLRWQASIDPQYPSSAPREQSSPRAPLSPPVAWAVPCRSYRRWYVWFVHMWVWNVAGSSWSLRSASCWLGT